MPLRNTSKGWYTIFPYNNRGIGILSLCFLGEKGGEYEGLTENEHEKLIHLEDRCKSNTHRIDELEKRADDTEKLVTSVAIIAEKQQSMEGDVREMKSDVKHLLEKPAKRWEGAVDKIVFSVLSALAAYLLARLGI